MKDSAAWQTTSRPQDEVTSGGMVSVSRGSTTPRSGRRYWCEMPVFTLCSGMSRIATVVASAPVPAVVGMARSGFRGPGGFLPPPTGALTYSMISPPCVAMRSETLAVSMLDPPPTATNPSKSPSTAKSAAAWNELSVGSTRERSHTSISTPSASINSTMRPVISAFTTPGSETSITRPTPICFSSQPASSEAPGPYFSGVASMVKMVSLFGLELLCMVVSFLSPRVVPEQLVPAPFGKYTYGWCDQDREAECQDWKPARLERRGGLLLRWPKRERQRRW